MSFELNVNKKITSTTIWFHPIPINLRHHQSGQDPPNVHAPKPTLPLTKARKHHNQPSQATFEASNY
jgi:hypothetical protein